MEEKDIVVVVVVVVVDFPFGDVFDRGLDADRTEGGCSDNASTSEIEASIDVVNARKTTATQMEGVRKSTIVTFCSQKLKSAVCYLVQGCTADPSFFVGILDFVLNSNRGCQNRCLKP